MKKYLSFLSLVTLLLLSRCDSVKQSTVGKSEKESNVTKEKMKIIDAHMHFNSPEKNHTQPSPEMLKEMEEAGVVGAVVHFEAGEEKLTELKIPSNLKMAICAAVVPGETVEHIEAGIKSKLYKCLKIYLGYVPKWANDSFYLPFYRLAEKHQIPVVFHTGDTYDKNVYVKYAEPLQLDEIAVNFPKVNFVIAHMGNPWIHSAAEVVYKNDNMWADPSAFILGDASKTNADVVDTLVIKPVHWFFTYVINPKKIMFGSDWPLLEVGPYVEAVKKAIPKEHWNAVFYQNAVDVFKLE